MSKQLYLYTAVDQDDQAASRRLADSESDVSLDLPSTRRRYELRGRLRQLAMPIIMAVMAFIIAIESAMLFIPASSPLSPIPAFKTHTESFKMNMTWEYSPEASALWAAIMPETGLIAVKDPERYGLPAGLETELEGAQVYGIQVGHEFHCLRMMRNAFVALVLGDDVLDDEIADLRRHPEWIRHGGLSHIFHCYDYLRQTILCRADLSIETRSQINPLHIDGYGSPRQCRDWDAVASWVATMLPPDEKFRGVH